MVLLLKLIIAGRMVSDVDVRGVKMGSYLAVQAKTLSFS